VHLHFPSIHEAMWKQQFGCTHTNKTQQSDHTTYQHAPPQPIKNTDHIWQILGWLQWRPTNSELLTYRVLFKRYFPIVISNRIYYRSLIIPCHKALDWNRITRSLKYEYLLFQKTHPHSVVVVIRHKFNNIFVLIVRGLNYLLYKHASKPVWIQK
jgi:hypothetical protein